MPIQMFDDGQAEFVEAVKGFGQQVGGILKERLYKKQMEDFIAGPTKDFRNHMQEAQDLLMDETNPEAPAQGMQMLKSGLETYMDEGARYADNPYVQQRVQATFKTNMDFLNMEFKRHFDAQAAENEKAKSGRKQEMFEAKLDSEKARTGKLRAETAKIKGGTEESDAPNLFSGRPGSIDQNLDEGDRARELWTRIQNTMDRPGSEAERKAVDIGLGDVRTQMAQLKLAGMAGRGEKRPAATDATGTAVPASEWDVFNQKHLEDVAATIDPTEVRNRFIMNKAQAEARQQGIDPETLDKEFGVVVDPSKGSAFRPLSQPVSQENLGKILFGAAGWDSLRDPRTKATPETLEDTVERLPKSIMDAQGPVAQVFQRLTVGELPENVDPASLKSAEDVKDVARRQAYKLIMAAIGNNAPANSLSEGMKQNRLDALNLVNAMADKYSDEIYASVSSRKKTTGMSDAEIARSQPVFGILGEAKRRAGVVTKSIIRPIKKAYEEYTGD